MIENAQYQKFLIDRTTNFAEVKAYNLKVGIDEGEFLSFCREGVVDWLKSRNVHRVEFAFVENKMGVKQVVFVLDADDTDWRDIPGIDDFVEVADAAPQYLKWRPQQPLVIP